MILKCCWKLVRKLTISLFGVFFISSTCLSVISLSLKWLRIDFSDDLLGFWLGSPRQWQDSFGICSSSQVPACLCTFSYCILLLPLCLVACNILFAVIRHFHAQVVVSCVLSSCSRLLNKTSIPTRNVSECFPISVGLLAWNWHPNEQGRLCTYSSYGFQFSYLYLKQKRKMKKRIPIFGLSVTSSYIHILHVKHTELFETPWGFLCSTGHANTDAIW